MSVLMELVSASCSTLPLKRPPLCSSSSMALLAPSLKFKSLSLKPSGHRLSFESSRDFVPKGLDVDFRSGNSLNRPIVAFAASHEDSHSKIEVEKESEDRKLRGEESEEVWKQALESFKEQALKLQSVSQEAYEIYSKKGMVVLQETSEKLKIQAEKAKIDLGGIAKEFGEDSIELLTVATENSPEPVKEVVETLASSTDNLNDVSKVRDFQLGIPYGLLLSTSGFLSFMLSGSLSSLRFGFILGGILLALSVSSLKSYKRAEPYSLALKGQAAIATIIFLRDISIIMTRRTSFLTPLATLISGAMAAFYLYKIALDGKQSKGSGLGYGAED
ncbi:TRANSMEMBRANE PROTEIN 14 15 [Salix purpurea]|uniref:TRANSMEMBRANE PROTEIN 14 15 n=1 Tax=Salix purpurea TaxID=77065 RepID=A0A9Q0Q3N7_SALPP|nr:TRANSMEMBRANE PROTEIN 14 15 [Salix purpurea]